MKIIAYGNPNALKRHRSRIVKDKIKGKLHILNHDPSSKDKAVLRAALESVRPDKPYIVALKVTLVAYFSRPQGHYTANDRTRPLKKTAPIFHTNVPDGDNVLKFVNDALNGIFWIDDKIIADNRCVKMYDDVPRIELTIEELEMF